MKHSNLWKPDHCQCEIEFTFDDSLAVDSQESSYELHTFHKKCPAHKALGDAEAYLQVLSENKAKNESMEALRVAHNLAEDDLTYAFDKQRNLILSSKSGALLNQSLITQPIDKAILVKSEITSL